MATHTDLLEDEVLTTSSVYGSRDTGNRLIIKKRKYAIQRVTSCDLLGSLNPLPLSLSSPSPLGLRPRPQRDPELTSMFSEVSGKPRGAEWLWHPQVVALYKAVLQNNTSSSVTREAALGALQNITIGESRVRTPSCLGPRSDGFPGGVT